MPLVALAPKYHPGQHQVYLDQLERALRHPDVRSVAVTGSYGSGKSSVLRELRRPRWGRRVIIELSLSTLDPELTPAVQPGNPAEAEMSNRIQKELVKQLLYQLPPRKTPHSRFPRASKPTWPAGAVVAVTTAVVVGLAWVVAALAGWQATITDRLNEVGWTVPLFWSAVTAGSVLLALAAWRVLAGRYALQAGLKAGALTVSLEPTSSSYFDQYLDEIMYFFQVSKTNVVLIEDVDRFGDAVVFDTLRALNTLVNSSGQVGRRVVFVYAIRDSVLGLIGAKKKVDGQSADAISTLEMPALELERANRAKYFDVIIPIVPFVTTDNARDLMMQVLKDHVADSEEGRGISPALIRLAAKHVADMRTLWSIRNEFEVHRDRLMTSALKMMPGINENIVLSLVLMRATSPEVYEGIRLTTSQLDKLTKRWLALVDANLDTQTRTLTELRTQLENGKSRMARAERAGRLLDSLRPELLEMAVGFAAAKVEFKGPLTDTDLADLKGWNKIANGDPLTVILTSKPANSWSPTPSTNIQLTSQTLARLIGMPIDPQAWQDADLNDLESAIARAENEISFLRHHTWAELCARTDLTVTADPGEEAIAERREAIAPQASTVAAKSDKTSQSEQLNFERLIRAYAPTPLAYELIAHGYLPRHFARYASMFYGEIVSLNAAEYISRAIEPGVPVPEYELDKQDIRQILSEQGAANDNADLFDDPSVCNLDFVRYLIEYRHGAAQRVASQLASRWGDLEQKFVGRFFQREEQEVASTLAALMAPTWRDALRYTTVDAPVSPATRLRLVDAVLGTIGNDEPEDLDADIGRYLSEHYAELAVVTDPPDEARASIVMATIAAASGTIRDLTKLKPIALAAATQNRIYPVTATNLEALGGADRVALDIQRLPGATRPIYDHALANLADYLDALAQLDPPGVPLMDPAMFPIVLNDIAGTPQAPLLDQFVEATPVECRIADLNEVAPGTWPSLVDNGRTDPSFDNVQRYISEYGIDEPLRNCLVEQTAISTPEETPQSDRFAVATEILAARETIPTPSTRVSLATSVAPGVIPIDQITVEDANLVGPMLAAQLLADDAETFDPALLNQWADFEAAVAASRTFGELADATIMPAHHLAQTLESSLIPGDTKTALVAKLASLLPGTTTEATAIAQTLTEQGVALDLARIEALRAAGASHASLVRLIVSQGEDLSLPDLRAVLLALQGDYGRVSRGGSGTVRFPVDEDHRILLDRLVGVTHTGTKVATTKTYGTNLEANLKQPSP